MPSLRNKILRTYGFSKLVMLGFAVVVFADLHYLDRQIDAGRVVTDFREATLEMRRDEKNLFLYGGQNNHTLLVERIKEAWLILDQNRKTFETIEGAARVREMEGLLQRYQNELDNYLLLTQDEQAVTRESVRDFGHALSESSREITLAERRLLAEVTKRARLLLVLAFAGVVVLGIAGGLYLARRVAKPLRDLESGLRAIDEGRARELPALAGDQEIRSFVSAFNAMLKHMRLQQDLAKRNEKAAALGVLVSGVAHELNNPLSNISTSAQLLLEDDGNCMEEQGKQWLAQIDSETERARRIVRRLLDSVRQPKLHRQRQSLADLVQSSLVLVNRHLPIGVQVCVGTLSDIEIDVDRERLQQVFINLIKNAADAGAKHITVSGQSMEWEPEITEEAVLIGDPAAVAEVGTPVRITVEDDGPGIPDDLREHIFDPFFTTRTGGEGTGLGLYLVEEIVGEHQGCLVLDSAAGQGTRFFIWLPGATEQAI